MSQNVQCNGSPIVIHTKLGRRPVVEVAPYSPVTHPTSICTEDDCAVAVEKQSTSMHAVLQNRVKSGAVVAAILKSRGVNFAVDTAINMNNSAVVVDLLHVLNTRSNLWSLDLCVKLLPQVRDLLHSKYRTYAQAAADCLKLVLKDFGRVVKNGLNIFPSIGVDVTQEERYNKCQKCYMELLTIRNGINDNKQKLATSRALNPHNLREICLLMQQLDS